MSTGSIQIRLIALNESLRQTQQSINRLAKLAPQPGTTGLQAQGGDQRLELGEEIHQDLKGQEEDFELLRQDIEDVIDKSSWSSSTLRTEDNKDKEKVEVAARAAKLSEDLKIARIQFRKAQLVAKRNSEAAKRKERELLLTGLQEGAKAPATGYGRRKAQDKLSQEELTLNASNDVSASLRRTHNLMSAELQRSHFARETLQNSTKDLTSLAESYSNLDTLLHSSRSLVSTLISSQKSDTWYLESAFFILCCTIGWLFFRRILYGPGWWLLYFPLRLLFRYSLLAVQVLVGALSAIAISVGAAGQGKALQQASGKIGLSLTNTPTAKGKADIPTFEPDMPSPSVKAGAGGQGAKEESVPGGSRSMSERVGEIVEGSGKGYDADLENAKRTQLRERREDEKPNPKKRMWEEPAATQHEDQRPRDEL